MTRNDKGNRKRDISFWIRRGLEQRDLTQAELARYIGVAKRTVSAWVTKTDLPLDENIEKIKQVFDEIPTTDEGEIPLVRSPLKCIECSRCDYQEECSYRVRYGYFAMCQSLSEKNLRWARANGVVQQVIWWREVDIELPVEELLDKLNVSSDDIID